MCGFVGYMYNTALNIDEEEEKQLRGMSELITHRGPDDEGFFVDQFVRFGFRRLSIIDLEHGRQPLSYENDRYWIIFNGEIYNYLELREELLEKGLKFETNSDTEVILALYSDIKEEAVKKLRGMFGFLIWDKQEERLFGARDPFGIKPFYYMEDDNGLYCASEKKSILWLQKKDRVNMQALQHYMTYQYPPEPATISEDIFKLEPGHYFTKKPGQPMNIRAYWKPSFQPSNHNTDEYIKKIRDTLRDSVNIHMRSDVPVGAFLSSGVDSSSIVALAKEFHPSIKTFTVGFEREGFSEIDIAKDTAAKLGVENIHYVIRPEEFIKELPRIVWHMDDPVADPAAIPLYFVAREASKHVTVVLSGEGADELFGGYNIYREPGSLKMFQRMPGAARGALRSLSKWMPVGMKGKSFLERGTTPIEERFIGNAKIFTEEEKQKLLVHYDSSAPYTKITRDMYERVAHYNDVHKMQYVDMHTWLRGDILVKADRMTMAHSLELRVPFLDKEVFHVASQLDPSETIANNTTKYALREAMRGVVPDSVLYNKKLGFPVPIRHWLKNELYDWAKNLINKSPTDHLINKQFILKKLDEHAQGKFDHSRKIWTVLVFLIWHQLYVEQNHVRQENLSSLEENQSDYMYAKR
ncbi:asparagine synthase (glutamine-hydrolyzing) [Pseudalkalibacillus caeni]|uniref:asparagine synthase (glutamine-hydrolyzing) n=1 Tax=Exobacillus caeni TaxID=2574798 RepID=A0A5R9F564_9BACL|nr:asparagine synthase (glutamine-hydrolyzing) [Pseudalkalibacillus caeni]TLS38882.1 asparagine synthase (glutamine-hydrolyzing) [Pseudalkalibacillus caeni]